MILTQTRIGRRILQRFVEFTTPFSFALPDGAHWRSQDCVIGPEDGDATLASLLEEFSREDLEAVGVLEVADDGDEQVSLCSEITSEAGPFLVLRKEADGPPTGLLTSDVELPGNRIPLEIVLEDAKTLSYLQVRDGMLFLCPTVGQVSVLRTLGLPAAPLDGISHLKTTGLQRLAGIITKAMPLNKTAKCPPKSAKVGAILAGDYEAIDRQEAEEKRRPRVYEELTIVLANWNPENWTEEHAAAIRDTAQFLANAGRLLGIELGEVVVWSPTRQEKADIEFMIHSGGKRCLWGVVRDSIESSNFTPAAFVNPELPSRESAASFADALREVQRRSSSNGACLEDDTAWLSAVADYDRFSFRDIVEPLAERASVAGDPLQRLLTTMTAQAACLLHRQTPELLRRLGGLAQCLGDDKTGGFPKDLIEQHRRTSEQLLKHIKESRK